MTIPAWPAINYKPRRDPWAQNEPYMAPIETDFEAGNTRLRQVASLARLGLAYEIWLQTGLGEPATFKSFVATTLANGTSRFTMSVYQLDGTYATKTCWLKGGTYTMVALGRDMLVRFTLMVIDG